MTAKIRDMTSGSPGKLIMSFAVPLMLGNIFQQLYTMVDTMVVGQVAGVEALAALGAVDWFVWMVLGISTGMTEGCSILIAQYFGAKTENLVRKSTAHSYVLNVVLALVMVLVFQGCAKSVLRLLNTPENILGMSLLYLRIIFWGIPITVAYNVFAAVLRALGNSKTPLAAMILAAVINIFLDILFVVYFDWGVAGAAIATVMAQAFSAVYCFLVIRKIELLRLSRENFEKDLQLDGKLANLGWPIVFQNMIICVGGMIVQFVINGYGFLFVAGFTATNKLYGVLEVAAISYGFAVVTYVGQNLGANKIERIKKGVKISTFIAFLTSLVISVIMIVFGKFILSMFISGDAAQMTQVLSISYKYLVIMASCLWILYFLHVYRSALQGLGDTVIPMLSGVTEFIMRVGIALLLPKLVGQNGIFFAEISAWTGAAILLMSCYFWRVRNLTRKYDKRHCNQ